MAVVAVALVAAKVYRHRSRYKFMSEKFIGASVAILLGIVGVAVLATLVSKQANTSNVISAGAGGFACVLRTALTGVNACGDNLTPDVNSTITFGGSPGGRGAGLF